MFTGAPKARAQELVHHTTKEVYKFVSNMMFDTHSVLFAVLVALERLSSSNSVTAQELSVFVNGVEDTDIMTGRQKPNWMDDKVWSDCTVVEKSLPCMLNLCQSLQEYSTQWQEYFQVFEIHNQI